MSTGGQTPVTQQTTQTRDPWAAAQPHLTGIMNAADQVFAGAGPYSNVAGGTGGYMPYSGQTLADLHPWTTQALNTEAGMIGQGENAGIHSALNLATQQNENYGLTPEQQNLYGQISTQQNPFLQNILDTNNRRIGDRINASMSGAGRYGSGQHTDVMARALSESADPILAQDYQQRQQMRNDMLNQGAQWAGQFAQLTPGLEQARFSDQDRLLGLGDVDGQRSQQQLADQIKLYNAQQAYPWEQLSRYNALIGGAGALGGTQITTSPIQQPSTLNKVLGGGLAGAGIGGSFGGPLGAGIGAGAGGLLGLL